MGFRSRPNNDDSQLPEKGLSHSHHADGPDSMVLTDNAPESGRALRPGDVTSKAGNLSRDNDETSRPSDQSLKGRPLDAAAGAIPATASGHVSRTREPRPAENRTTVVPAAPSNSHQTTARHNNTSEHGVELGIQSRGQVCSMVSWSWHL